MKQTKKLTRTQRNFLLKNKVNIEGVRVLQDTKDFMIYVTADGVQHRIEK